MKFFAALVAVGALCQTAIAQTPDCKSIPNPAARLACYDKAAPPAAVSARHPQGRGCARFRLRKSTAQNTWIRSAPKMRA